MLAAVRPQGRDEDLLGYEKHDRAGRDEGDSHNGRRARTVLTDMGPVETSVPRDVENSFPGDPGIWAADGGVLMPVCCRRG